MLVYHLWSLTGNNEGEVQVGARMVQLSDRAVYVR